MPREHYRDAPGGKSTYFIVFLGIRGAKSSYFIVLLGLRGAKSSYFIVLLGLRGAKSSYLIVLLGLRGVKSSYYIVLLGLRNPIRASLSHETLFICLYTLLGERESVEFYREKLAFCTSKIDSEPHPCVIVA